MIISPPVSICLINSITLSISICDAQMFADEAYCENEFDSLEEFAKNASEGEGDTIENTIKRLNEMLIKGILKLK